MKLTEKDKTLLFVLGVLLFSCFPYFFIIQPFSEKSLVLKEEVKELENRKRHLIELELQRDTYIREMQDAGEEKERLLARFPADIRQEESILFLYDTEKRIPITLSQAAFDDDLIQQVGTNSPDTEEQINTDNTGAEETTEAIIPDLTGVCAQSQIIYSGEYKNFKDFLKYILEYGDRMVITDLNAVYSADMNNIMGNLVLKRYAVRGEGRKEVRIKEPELRHGTSNVFMQASGIASSEEESGQADFFLMLSQPEADVETVIFGQSSDGTGGTHLTSDKNEIQEMAVSFKGSNGEYTANYQIGDEKLSDRREAISFNKEGEILFEIISSPRVGKQDKVAASLDIINKTDRKVIVTVRNDDTNPRVTIAGKTGDITVK